MDAELLRRADGPVVVTALAGAVGREYRTANDNGVRHFRALGADVVAAPDAREDLDGALEVLRTARLLVLPGGSPSRLLEALRGTGVDGVVTDLLAAGGVVSGSSAGAMVLCGWTVLPDRPGPAVEPGLGVVPGVLVLPHWSGDGRADWLRAVEAAVPPGVEVLGVPEQSGVLVDGASVTAVGSAATSRLRTGGRIELGETWEAAA
jgi:cyanophycinase